MNVPSSVFQLLHGMGIDVSTTEV